MKAQKDQRKSKHAKRIKEGSENGVWDIARRPGAQLKAAAQPPAVSRRMIARPCGVEACVRRRRWHVPADQIEQEPEVDGGLGVDSDLHA